MENRGKRREVGILEDSFVSIEQGGQNIIVKVIKELYEPLEQDTQKVKVKVITEGCEPKQFGDAIDLKCAETLYIEKDNELK